MSGILGTRTALTNGTAGADCRDAALACGIVINTIGEEDTIALALANVLDTFSSTSAGQGYLTGSGGSVVQSTSKSTGVTLNNVTGQITMNNASLANATAVTFTVTCSSVLAGDVVHVNHASAGTLGGYLVCANGIVAGTSFNVTVYNVSGGPLSEAIVLNYAIQRGSSS